MENLYKRSAQNKKQRKLYEKLLFISMNANDANEIGLWSSICLALSHTGLTLKSQSKGAKQHEKQQHNFFLVPLQCQQKKKKESTIQSHGKNCVEN